MPFAWKHVVALLILAFPQANASEAHPSIVRKHGALVSQHEVVLNAKATSTVLGAQGDSRREIEEHEWTELGDQDGILSECSRRRRDPCACRLSGSGPCCNMGRCSAALFVGGPMKIQQVSNGCGRYLIAKTSAVIPDDDCNMDGRSLQVWNFSDLNEPPHSAQWNIVFANAGSTNKFKLEGRARKAAQCLDSYLRAEPSSSGGSLEMDSLQSATEWEIYISGNTDYYEIKMAGVHPEIFLNNPVNCFDGAMPTLGRTPDLWRIAPNDQYGAAGANFGTF